MSTLKVSTLQNASSATANITLDTAGNATVGGTLAMGSSFKRNSLINGNFQIAQRTTTYALTSSVAYGSVDRWVFFQSGTANGTANQVSAGLTNFQYALRLGRNTSAVTTGIIVAAQAIETSNSIPLAGQSVTLSFYAKAGANFSASSSNISVQVYSGTGTDQSASTWISSGWTGGAYPINTTQAITSSWVRYTFTGTVSSSATQLGVLIQYTPVGTAGADDYLYITGVQLEVGSVATPYERQIYSDQLAQCQRYYQVVGGGAAGRWSGATTADMFLQYNVVMRSAPTISAYANGAFTALRVGIASVSGTGASVSFGSNTTTGAYFGATFPSAGASSGEIASLASNTFQAASEI